MTEDSNTQDLTGDLTRDLTDSEKLNLLLADLAQVKAELADLRAWREDRARDTRPKLELIHKEIADQGQRLRDLRADYRILREHVNYEARERLEMGERIAVLENRTS